MNTTNQSISVLVSISIICTAQILIAFGLLVSLDTDASGIVTGYAIGLAVILLMIALCMIFSKIVDCCKQNEISSK